MPALEGVVPAKQHRGVVALGVGGGRWRPPHHLAGQRGLEVTRGPPARGSRARSVLSAASGAAVCSALEGDEVAWERLVESFNGLIRAIARAHRLNEHDAADVTQTTWLRALEQLDRLRDPECAGAWLATIARRECLRTLRGSAREIPAEHDALERQAVDAGIDDKLLAEERDSALWRALGALPSRHRTLLRLLYAEPAPSYQEISHAIGMPVGSIGPTRGRGLELLRREAVLAGVTAEAG